MRNERRDLERELETYQRKLMEYRHAPKQRAHYEQLYLDTLGELSQHGNQWRSYAIWYSKYEGW